MGFPLLDNYIEKYGPAARELGETARAYAERVIARLDGIHRELEILSNFEDYEKVHAAFNFTISAGTDNDPNTKTLGRVPRDEIWIIEAVARAGTEVGGIISQPNLTFFQDGALRADFEVTWPSGTGTIGSRITGPSELTMRASNFGADVQIYVQVCKLIPLPKRTKTNRIGFGEPEFLADRNGLADTDRHIGALNGN